MKTQRPAWVRTAAVTALGLEIALTACIGPEPIPGALDGAPGSPDASVSGILGPVTDAAASALSEAGLGAGGAATGNDGSSPWKGSDASSDAVGTLGSGGMQSGGVQGGGGSPPASAAGGAIGAGGAVAPTDASLESGPAVAQGGSNSTGGSSGLGGASSVGGGSGLGGSGHLGGSSGTGGSGAGCVATLGSCSSNLVCCNYQESKGYCIDFGTGGQCQDLCSAHSDCASGCCSFASTGTRVCGPPSACGTGIGDACFGNSDCSSGTCAGASLWCTAACSDTDYACAGGHGTAGLYNEFGQVNWCLRNRANSYSCFPGCSSDTDCIPYSGTTCQSTTDITGRAVQVCSTP